MLTSLTPEAILAHPGFARARAAHVDSVIGLFRGDRFVTGMMADAGIIILRGLLVGFHMSFDAADPATWATPGNVSRALVARGLASPRRVADLLARFRQAGYVEDVPAPADRRSSLLVPTAGVIAHDRDHLAAYHLFLHALYPERGFAWALSKDERSHRAIRRAAMGDLPHALTVLEHAALRLFLSRDAGYLALLLVMRAHLSGEEGPTWTAMAADCGVARSHLRNLFAQAEAAGLVRLRAGRGRPVELLPPLLEGYDRFLAGMQAGQDVVAQVAFAAMARETGAGPA